MKNIYNLARFAALLVLPLLMLGCKDDDFDGLQDIDPVPAAAITFPQSVQSNGVPLLEDNAYIIQQNSLQQGSITVQLSVPQGREISAVSVAAQRFRGTIPAGSVSPSIPSSATLRAPAANISRSTPPNLGTDIPVGPGNTVTFEIPLPLPEVLTNATLGELQAGDVIRFFFTVTLTDGSTHRAVEARVFVTG